VDQGDFDPADIEVFVGIDMAKGDHYAQAITAGGEELFDQPVANDETAITQLIQDAAGHGTVALVVDQPASGAQLLLAVARDGGVPVAYVTGLQMRRAADLYAGSAKTDPRDAWVLAEFARRNADRLAWLSVSDELLTSFVSSTAATSIWPPTPTGSPTGAGMPWSRSPRRWSGPWVTGSDTPVSGICWPAGATPTALRRAGCTATRWLHCDALAALRRAGCTATRWPVPCPPAYRPPVATAGRQGHRRGLRGPRRPDPDLPADETWGEVIVDLAGDLERVHLRRAELARQIEEVFSQHPLAKGSGEPLRVRAQDRSPNPRRDR
jgi:hypothetical protein